jgi:hypothetical protein
MKPNPNGPLWVIVKSDVFKTVCTDKSGDSKLVYWVVDARLVPLPLHVDESCHAGPQQAYIRAMLVSRILWWKIRAYDSDYFALIIDNWSTAHSAVKSRIRSKTRERQHGFVAVSRMNL